MADGISLIELRNRKGVVVAHAIVDSEDEAIVRQRGLWSLAGGSKGKKYVCHSEHVLGSGRPGKHVVVMLHRVLLGLERGDPRKGDHINRDPLDNRRQNLRIVTSRENSGNLSAWGRSPYRGVSWHTTAQRWRATVCIDGISRELGRFRTQEEAAAVASAYRIAHMPGALE